MRLMLSLITLALLIVAVPATGFAACGGRDLMRDLQAEDPEAHRALLDRAQQTPNASGKFWQVSRPGTAPSHLFGTFHDTEAHDLIGPEIWDVLSESEAALFELSLAEEQRMQADMAARPMELLYDVTQVPLSERLSSGQKVQIEAALAERGIPFAAAEQMRGWMLVALLGFPACQVEELQAGAPSLDQRLARFAVAQGLGEGGLETYEQSLAAIETLPFEEFAQASGEIGEGRAVEEDLRRTRLALYASGDIMAISEFGIWYSEQQGLSDARAMTDRFFEAALTQRNIAWLERLLPALEAGNTFVAVGALHLPGESGLVELLRQRGWTVTRLDG
ncbi:MAG: TraB/GumN family protein [Pseudomonadota bacterium]